MLDTNSNSKDSQAFASGNSPSHRYQVTPEILKGFLLTFRDYNPLHMDRTFALDRGYSDRVMHGAILNGFLSHFIGTIFPGPGAVILSVDMRYTNPTYLNDEIELSASVEHHSNSNRLLTLRIQFWNRTQNQTAARGRLQVKHA